MKSSDTIVHYKLLKYDLDTLLKSVSGDDHDIYFQRTKLRNGIKAISERCGETIKLLESEK